MVWNFLFPIAFQILTQSPFAFELHSGFAAEPFVGTDFLDDQDDSGLRTGLRISWLHFDESDSSIAPELSFNSRIFKDASGARFTAYNGEAGVAVYEVYNPFVIRFAGGMGVEFRKSVYSPYFVARLAAGYFFCPRIGIYLETATRAILRDTTQSEYSYPMDLSSSLQFIF